jgi:carboxylesterase type B
LLYVEDGLPSTATGDEIVEFLRRQSSEALATLDDKFYAVVDGHVLPSVPVNIYASAAHNNIDLMVGVNSDEGYMIYSAIISKFGITPDQLDASSVRAFITDFATGFFSFPNAEVAGEAIASHYLNELGSTASPAELQTVATECVGDMLFVIPAIQTANFHSRTYSIIELVT